MNLLNEYNQHFTNFQLAHEIILNPNFQFQYLNEEEGNNVKDEKASNIDLSEDKYNNIISKVTKIAQKAFFNLVQESFDSGNETQFIPGIIKDIKDRLLYLTNKNKKTYDQINEVLDEKLIIQQIQHGTTDFNNIFKFVLDTMLQLCAPIRDPIIKKIYTMETPVQKIKAILNQLDNMKIDLANYNIKKFRPILKNFAVEYERKKFKEAIKSNLIDLQYTERWLTQSIVRLIKKQSNIKLTKELKKKKKENQTRYIDIYNDAFSSLLFKREIVNNDKTLVELGNTKLPNNNNNSESNNCIDNNKSKYSSNSTNKMSNVGSEDGRCSPSKMNKKNNNSKDDEIILPETLMFDFNRVLEYQKDLRDIAIVSSIIILCQSIVPYLHGKEFIVNNLYSELLDYIENNIPKQKQKQSENKESSDDDRTTFVNNDNKSETNVEEGKKKNKMDKESKLSSIMADFSKYIVTKIETVILDSVINYNNVITNYVKLEPKILSANEKVLLKKMIVNILMLNNNMYNVISRQIMSLFLHYLKTGIFKTETLDRFCLQYSKDRLEKIFIKIKFFTEYNRDVYSEYYDNIISKLLIIYKFYPS
ncbi:hypothetical protein BCR36DRAFT_397930 [Piromyces finnis]|uniref:T-complex 11 n=1 Tax=Piromyces finnis TaxID=1754191 RepID=A0A1Y1V838_9FUNG|nr:hypothetical protein BCR36DRAFT_397930 [Piromyces finnis]|eukprot:ORX49350.1 hypothetical protein BCR36DRAFT_397930 [Piromyces finnis]